jgi:hypothetical protein
MWPSHRFFSLFESTLVVGALLFVVVGFAVGGCTSKNSAYRPTGSEGGVCFPNQTCSQGLICRSGLCVDPAARQDGGRYDSWAQKDGGVFKRDAYQRRCGNGYCELGENSKSCPQDCSDNSPTCGDGRCEAGENSYNCPYDCSPQAVCGNGKCDYGESPDICPADCAPPKTAGYQEPCTSGSQCTGDLKCVGDAGAKVGFCTNTCKDTSDCPLVEGATDVECDGGYCTFFCRFTSSCPPKLNCDFLSSQCRP